MIEILRIDYVNGEKCPLDYDYRKTKFDSIAEMETYKKNLEKKLDKSLLITFINYNDRKLTK